MTKTIYKTDFKDPSTFEWLAKDTKAESIEVEVKEAYDNEGDLIPQ